MLGFGGRIGRIAFLQAVALSMVLLVASFSVLPAVMPLAYVLFVLCFVVISTRRARDAGMPALAGLFIPLLLAFNYHFVVSGGLDAVLRFFVYAYFHAYKSTAALALYCIAILCILPSRERRVDAANPFGIAGLLAFVFALYIAAIMACFWLIPLTGYDFWGKQAIFILPKVFQFTPNVNLALAAVLAWIAFRYRSGDEAAEAQVSTA